MDIHTPAEENNVDVLLTVLRSKNTKVDLNQRKSCFGHRLVTALILAILHNSLSCVKALLLAGANPNLPDIYGRSPLHLATFSCRHQPDMAIRRAIIYTLHMFKAQRCGNNCKDSVNCRDHCKYRGKDRGDPPSYLLDAIFDQIHEPLLGEPADPPSASQTETGRVLLSLDGGGTKVIGIVRCLIWLQQEIRRITRNPKASLIDYVQFCAGSSAGGLVILALAAGHSLEEVRDMFYDLKDSIFAGSPRYDGIEYGEILQSHFRDSEGRDLTMADLKKSPKLLVAVAKATRRPVLPMFIKNYVSPNPKPGTQEVPLSTPVWRVARCTSSAPTYFKLVDAEYVDGGMGALNPTMMASVAMRDHKVQVGETGMTVRCIASFGAGVAPVIDSTPQKLDWKWTDVFFAPIETVERGLDLKDTLLQIATKCDFDVVDADRNHCAEIGAEYFRFAAPLSRIYDLDTKDAGSMIEIEYEHYIHMERFRPMGEKLARLMIYYKAKTD